MSLPKKPHPARRARRITGAVSAASFLGLGAWFAAHAPSTTSASSTTATKSTAAQLDGEIEQSATSYLKSSAATTSTVAASTAHTTSRGS